MCNFSSLKEYSVLAEYSAIYRIFSHFCRIFGSILMNLSLKIHLIDQIFVEITKYSEKIRILGYNRIFVRIRIFGGIWETKIRLRTKEFFPFRLATGTDDVFHALMTERHTQWDWELDPSPHQTHAKLGLGRNGWFHSSSYRIDWYIPFVQLKWTRYFVGYHEEG